MAPLVNVRDDLFRTLRNRRSIVSVEEFEADKASLLRMLAEFQEDLQACCWIASCHLQQRCTRRICCRSILRCPVRWHLVECAAITMITCIC